MKRLAGLLVIVAVGLFLMVIGKFHVHNLFVLAIYIICCPIVFWGFYLLIHGKTIEEDNEDKNKRS